MRPIYLIISAPVIVLSFIYFLLNKRVRHGLYVSRAKLSHKKISSLDINLIGYLVAGEDHRFYSHAGFDPISIFRAISKCIKYKKIEGASTIEQQYVRTCTRRYDVSIFRKIDEIAVASLLSTLEHKDEIAYSYLEQAYYGNGIHGINGASASLNFTGNGNFESISHEAAIISLLKHPIPNKISGAWVRKNKSRAMHIQNRYRHLNRANKSLKWDVFGFAKSAP